MTSVEFFPCPTEATDNNHVMDLGVTVPTHTGKDIVYCIGYYVECHELQSQNIKALSFEKTYIFELI